MEIPPALLQFLGSLAAIFALAGLAFWLKLGPERVLASQDEARAIADEAVSGFDAVHVSLDTQGRGALLRDRRGRILLLRPHGAHFAGRILAPEARARMESDVLIIDTAERRYGTARLRIEDASAWIRAIEAIE